MAIKFGIIIKNLVEEKNMTMTIQKSGKTGPDLAFAINAKVKAAQAKYGKANVINAVLGTLADDEGNIIALDSFYKRLETIDRGLIASYAPIEGEKTFRDTVINLLFEDYRPEAYIEAVSTPGGTGAIRNGIFSYADIGDPVICHDYFWQPYQKMCREFDRDFRTYNFFTKDFKFDLASYKKCQDEALKDHDRLVSIINSPGNNPTGYSLSDEEWDEVLEISKQAVARGKKITLLIDVAYIEFAGDGEQKKFFQKFSNLPENLMVLVAFSMSKAYTAYGLRSGAVIGISSSKEVIEEFKDAMASSARVNWSNGVHAPQLILVDLAKDENKGEYDKELASLKAMLRERADVFVEEAFKHKLDIIPYFGGFFAFVPTPRAFEITENLEKENIFTIPSAKGIRIALCATNKKDVVKLVERIAFYMDK